jgi:periplasmic divalent cation tolerance protein
VLSDPLLVLTTCGDEETASELAEALIAARLAACVNTVSNVRSTYRWNGNIERATEFLLIIKTSTERYEALEGAIRSRSGYELPEVLAVRIDRGLPEYLEWVKTNTED